MTVLLSGGRARQLLMAAAAGIMAELCAVGLIATAAWLVARAAQQPSIAAVSLAIVGVRAFATLRGGFRYVERLAGHDAALSATADLRGRVYDAAVARPMRRDGDVLTRLVADTDSVQDLLLRGLLPAVAAATVGGAATVLCVALLPSAGAVLAAGLVLAGVLVPACSAVAARGLGIHIATARAALASHTLDLVDGHRELVAFGALPRAQADSRRHSAILAAAERQANRINSATRTAGVLIQGACVSAVLLVALRSGMDTVVTAVLALTTLAAMEVALPLADAAQHWVQARPALARVTTLLATTPPSAPAPTWSPNGALVLSGIRVCYGDRIALDSVDLTIHSGTAVAVVGASGAGKSTLAGVLAGLVVPQEGDATLAPARALTQDAYLFHTSIRANLALARPDATTAQLATAARLAGIQGWIESLPDGWDTTVGEGGRRLSGGQRQRLVLARALLADPPVLILDEPTESLDADQADEVLRAVLAARRGRTTVVVTHRLATLPEFDEILVLDSGRITSSGTHATLVARRGPYRDLWDTEQLTERSCR